ncbi:MAG: cache domain-containing protein [Sulfurimonas sp.]|jgi:diguanylate cyclase (GGDEF)-like protein
MFKEKTFLNLITYAPLVVIPLFFLVVTILSYQMYLQSFESSINNLGKDILNSEKKAVEDKVLNLTDIIIHKKAEIKSELTSRVKNRVEIAYTMAENIYNEYKETKSEAEIKNIIKTTLKTFVWNDGESFIWIVDYEGIFNLTPKYLKDLEGTSIINFQDSTGRHVIQEEIAIAKEKGEGFIWDTFTKPNEDKNKQYEQVAFVKAFGHYNWYFGSAEYLDTATKKTDRELFSLIDTVDSTGKNYVFLLNTKGKLLLHKYLPQFIGEDRNITNKLVTDTLHNIIDTLKDKDKIGYVYDWYNQESDKMDKKYAFIQKIPNSNWIIGSGFYLSDIEKMLMKQEVSMYKTYNLKSQYIFYIVMFIILLALIFSYYVSNMVKNSFFKYNEKISDKTKQLVELNQSLEQKVAERTDELNKIKDNFEKLATTDALTSMHNRYFIMKILSSEISRSNRYKTPLSLIMYDIDFFKNVNDTYGHDVGDTVLFSLSTFVMENLREVDIVGRYGGEEFLIILPNTMLVHAKEYAQRLRKKVEEHSFEAVGKVTISMGIVEIEPAENINEIFKRVDNLLYTSKNSGRNRISF